ncbi:hypothetical protein [Parathalassolituus penaei]|uniref:Uncharacterized protein n=1 Tax=Parathalassolituus penaei TaxID=2997323 RepID=A0A9X3IU21_9GAMM|nr:hypothetical protein [Parathalassolituus penaei]MCY0966504.1 hypothetical protein [Parathalassolituus penaei]
MMMNEFNLMIYAQSALLLTALAFVSWLFLRTRRLGRLQDDLVEDAIRDGCIWHRVYLMRGEGKKRWLRMLPYDFRGLLLESDQGIRLVGLKPDGEKLDQGWRREQVDISWQGNHMFAGGSLFWLRLEAGQQEWLVSSDIGMQANDSRRATADLWRKLVPGKVLPDEASEDFDLFSRPASVAALVLILVAAAYALVDGLLLNPLEALDWGYAMWGLPVLGLLVSLGGWFVLQKNRIPLRESMVLGMIGSICVSLAWLPAAKRLDEALASGPAQHYDYRLEENGRLVPVDENMPVIRFGNRKEYWQQFEIGSVHAFRFVHGPLGIWQLDHTERLEDIRAFYRQRKP